MKRGQKYVVRCHTAVSRSKVALGNSGRFRPGDFVMESGSPTRDVNRAAVYRAGKPFEEFPFDDDCGTPPLETYFEAVPVTTQLVITELKQQRKR